MLATLDLVSRPLTVDQVTLIAAKMTDLEFARSIDNMGSLRRPVMGLMIWTGGKLRLSSSDVSS